jgi:predicted RNA binding protein YcfA (HicA-like mRNA interferase family)
MPPLPPLSGREVVKVLEGLGWEVARQRGSHIVLVRDGFIAAAKEL